MIRRYNIAFLLLAFLVPASAEAQFGRMNHHCRKCLKKQGMMFPYAPAPMMPAPMMVPPVVSPCCPPVVAPVCPQVQTTFRQEQYTTYRPVTKTEVRREAVTVNVPVTTHKQVTVDEGGYKMVWVPKLTTKTVAETTIQKQVQYRDVSYQVVQNVPEVRTRLVPQQTVAYQPPVVASPCCGPNKFSAVPYPVTSTIPQTAAIDLQPVAQQQVVPSQPSATEQWVKVPQKPEQPEQAQAPAEIELQAFERAVPIRSAKGMFSRPTATSTALRTNRLY